MKRTLLSVSAVALALTVAACGGKDEAANNTAAADEPNAMMADAGPFADSEMRMSDAMMAAVGVNVGDSWVRKMIEHHKGAVEMARQVLTQNPDAHVAKMANETIDKQTKEIAALEKLVAQGTPNQASAHLYRPAIEQMHDAMMGATGADLSETFHRKMLEHHKGAIAMSDVALANGVIGTVRAQIEKTKTDQQKEAQAIEAMLSGKPATSEPPASTAAPSPAPAKPAEAKPSAPAADKHSGHDMNNMSDMDMNAMNHM